MSSKTRPVVRDDRSLGKHNFTPEQIRQNLANAKKDLAIARHAKVMEIRFQFSYAAFIKAGIALLSLHAAKPKSATGHHVRIIAALAGILNDGEIEIIGNIMRMKRNQDFYGGGIVLTEKEAAECLAFTEGAVARVEEVINAGLSCTTQGGMRRTNRTG